MTRFQVRFTGKTARSGPLAFGHANIVRAITLDDDPTRLNLAMVFDVPGAPVDQVAAWLRVLLERHESLRTTYSFGDRPLQHVLAEGEVEVEVVESDGDVLRTAESTARALRSRVFDLTAELPLRLAVVTENAVPRRLVWVVSHAAMDVATCELLLGEWTELAAGHELPVDDSPQPLDVVELEKTPAVQRLGQAATRYWESKLRTVPQAMFPVPATGTGFLRPGLRVRSRAAMGHIAAIAERTSASPSAIALAALNALIAHWTAQASCVTTSLSGNRVLKQLRRFFGSMAQDALLPVTIPETFDELVHAVRAASVPAYRHSWFEADAIWEVITRVTHERGFSFARDLVFNDMSALGDAVVGEPPRAAYGRLPSVWLPGGPDVEDDPEIGGTLELLPQEDIPTRFFGCLYRLDTELDLTLWVDPGCLDTAEVTEFGRGLLALLRAAAEADLPVKELHSLTTLAPIERGEGWYLSDSCWVELDAVRELVSDVLGDRPHLVTAEPDDVLGHRLVCHLTGPATAADLHARVLAALPGRPTALAPHHYVICAEPPADPLDPVAWTATAIDSSSGRELPV
ncbi:condensation domain-containing protein [Amycolatopsis sp. SB7-3]|uniref:condensation domain-containing protein n=1 Tax=Amycolatopsis sp. SB7-3 TaxID=3373438 RepID=UPI0037436247